jgi:hypothetical protein
MSEAAVSQAAGHSSVYNSAMTDWQKAMTA